MRLVAPGSGRAAVLTAVLPTSAGLSRHRSHGGPLRMAAQGGITRRTW